MLRLIIIIILFRIIWKLIKSLILAKLNKIANNVNNANNFNKNNKFKNNNQNSKKLTKCSICDVYLPIEDAIYVNDESFCSRAHAEQKKY
jgi:ABC-type transport system involved in multi-copper enzyme maturation permease subunit